MKTHRPRTLRVVLLAGALAMAAGCASPFDNPGPDMALRRSILEQVRRELAPPTQGPGDVNPTRETSVERFVRENNLQPWLAELNKLAGPDSYDYAQSALPAGNDLEGRPQQALGLSLEDAVRLTVKNNLQVQFARLSPAITEQQVQQAEAAFDWVFFSNFEAQSLDQPTTDRSTIATSLRDVYRQEQSVTSTSGFRRQLISGGEFTFQHRVRWSDVEEGSTFFRPNPGDTVETTFQFDQPILRNFGSDVALAQVRLAQNSEREAITRLRSELITRVLETEREYWRLVQAHRDLLITQRLLERGEETLRQLRIRMGMDAKNAQVATASSRVEDRRANVIRAQNVVRRSSDRLKALINDPDVPVTSELLLLPADAPLDDAIRYSLADAMATAVQNRPEVDQAILSIDNATIRKVVADNARLPSLTLRLQTRINALNDDFRSAYADEIDRHYIDYLVGLFFEVPVGNRAAEAVFRQRSLERQQAVISFRNTVQQIALELKNAIDNLATNYIVIEQQRTGRLASAESLRALVAENETIAGRTIERLELQLNRQEGLAAAERAEIQAIVDYNISVAELHAAMGTLLERNRIEFVVPDNPGRTGG